MITPDPSGWTVAITHPDTGRVRQPEVVDLQNAPVYNPGPNAQPVARIPVAKNDVWLSDAYDDDPEMRVWRDGRRLPIEVLRNVEQREGATVLIGVGGVELEGRVTEEYNDDRRHLAVRDLVETETTYGVDAPEPDTATLSDVSQQAVDSETEWLAALANESDDTELWEVSDTGELQRRQTGYFAVPTDDNTYRGTLRLESGYIDGRYYRFEETEFNNQPAGITETFSVDHTITGENVVVAARLTFPTNNPDDRAYHHGFEIRVNGTVIESVPADAEFQTTSPEWLTLLGSVADPDVSAGNVEVQLAFTEESAAPDGTDPYTYLDGFAIYDDRGEPTLGGVTGPDEKAEFDLYAGSSIVETADIQSAFAIPAARLEATINDTSGPQSVGLSNDTGSTWIDEPNSATVDADFASPSSTLRARFELGGYTGETQFVAGQTNAQAVDAYELFADISQELLLIAETFDNSLTSVLTSIGEPAERSWGLRTDANGDIVVRFVQNGQFVADYTPEFSDRTREKLGKTYDVVSVKGSNEPESNVPYTASTSYTALPRNNILTGSETVYDDTTNYERGDDYEMRYRDGEIRATDGGDLTLGDDYRIDFRYQAQGTFEAPDAPADPDELVETVPGVTSERLAEQVAFVIASEADAPRYAAEVTIPDPDPRFDPTEALPPSALGLPSAADDLEVRGEPQLTEEGLRVRFGTRPSVEQTQQRLSRQLSRVSDRS